MIKDQVSTNIQEMGDKMFAHLSEYNDQLSKEMKDKNNVMLAQLVSIRKKLSSKNHPLFGEDQQATCGDCIKLNDDMVAHVPVRELLDFDIAVHQNDATTWLQYLLKSNEDPLQVAPAIMRIHGSIKDDIISQSRAFYIFEKGHLHLMIMRVYLNGHGNGEGTHVSFYLHMKGPHDDKLVQSGHCPLRGTFTVEILNQLNNNEHYTINMTLGTNLLCEFTTEHDIAVEAWGKPRFISHDNLLNNNNYYSNNSLYFRVSYDNNNHLIAPVTIELSDFTVKEKEWISSPFFAFKGGYQMCLRIIFSSNDDVSITEFIGLYLMKGPHDDKLEQSGHWPLRGTFTIEVLNQKLELVFTAHSCSKCTKRVITGYVASEGWNYFTFHNNGLQNRIVTYSFKISYSDNDPYTLPITLTVPKFTEKIKKKEIHNSIFFAFHNGYLMLLKVYTAGQGSGEGTHVSVFLHLMKGPHDDKLEQSGRWPLRGAFIIELLNQLNKSDHHTCIVQLHHHFCSECTNRVLKGVIATDGHGQPQFISHTTLYNNYLKDDSLTFRVSHIKDIEHSHQVAPVTFRIKKVSKWLEIKEHWYSSPFFAFKEGYQLYLNVYISGDGEGTHVSVYLHFMKGPHDDKLEQSGHWPLRGIFTIELLNQLDYKHHHSQRLEINADACGDCANRVVKGNVATTGWGILRFILHDAILNTSTGYVKNDSIYFRISYEDTEIPAPCDQVAPVTLNMSYFPKINSQPWFSSPFFAFNEGYQMCLRVDAAGNGQGAGTHVSVFLVLMKGPHDDKLEQSGHWPLRGTFTIELLDKLNDNFHYSKSLAYTAYADGDSTNRVLKGNIASNGWGLPQFISYDILHYSKNGYLKDDTLYFRISYQEVNWERLAIFVIVCTYICIRIYKKYMHS